MDFADDIKDIPGTNTISGRNYYAFLNSKAFTVDLVILDFKITGLSPLISIMISLSLGLTIEAAKGIIILVLEISSPVVY
jgi:hypothetical protein